MATGGATTNAWLHGLLLLLLLPLQAQAVDVLTPVSSTASWGWLHRGYDARHSDYARDLPSLPNSCSGATPPSAVASWQANQGAISSVSSAPLLVYPPIPYGASATALARIDGMYVFAGNDSIARGFSAQTGRWRWSFGTESAVTAPLGFDSTRGLALVGTVRGSVYALGTANGTLAWLATGLPGKLSFAGVVYAPPPADLVFVCTEYVGGGTVTALDAGTGAAVWTYTLPFVAAQVTPVVSADQGTIFVGSHSGAATSSSNQWMLGGVVALRTSRAPLSPAARLLWTSYLTPQGARFGQLMPKLVLSADGARLYFSTRSYATYQGSTLFALATATQPNGTSQILWMVRTPSYPWVAMGSPSVYDGPGVGASSELVIVAAESPNPDCCAYEYARLYVRAYAAATGVQVWEHVEAGYASWNGGAIVDVSPVIAGPPGSATVYVPTRYGYIFALKVADGTVAWSDPLGADGSAGGKFYRKGVTAPPILTPSGALITVNEAPFNQVRLWGNASFPAYIDPNNSVVSCAAPLPTSDAGRAAVAAGVAVMACVLAGLAPLATMMARF